MKKELKKWDFEWNSAAKELLKVEEVFLVEGIFFQMEEEFFNNSWVRSGIFLQVDVTFSLVEAFL